VATPAAAAQPGARQIALPGDRFFPEGVTAARDGTLYVGSMEEGSIVRAAPGAAAAEPFITAGANGLVSVLGVLADDARGLLWACSSDAGNARLSGSAPVAVKSFDLATGAPKGSYELPGGGFCNDLALDAAGNLYVTDSWSPRLLRLPAGGAALEVWLSDSQLGAEQWSLNGIDVDTANNLLYTVNQRAGKLFRIAIGPDGKPGAPVQISTSQPLRRPDGLKVVRPGLLATAEGGSGGMALLTLSGDSAQVKVVSEGLDGVATFALWGGSAWIVENQGQHFWDPDTNGRDAKPPFRLVEVPLGLQGAPAAAPPAAAPPATVPRSLPRTGADPTTPALLLGAALLGLLGGAALRRRARR
jgi:LPXTG-motif cell wall-anchored protein